MEKKKLSRIRQCNTCPWLKASNPYDIPGYNLQKHQALKSTIAHRQGLEQLTGELRSMSCHYSKQDDEQYCVGWLYHQTGVGNNIALRLDLMRYSNAGDLTVIGEQHEDFEDTLPSEEQKYLSKQKH